VMLEPLFTFLEVNRSRIRGGTSCSCISGRKWLARGGCLAQPPHLLCPTSLITSGRPLRGLCSLFLLAPCYSSARQPPAHTSTAATTRPRAIHSSLGIHSPPSSLAHLGPSHLTLASLLIHWVLKEAEGIRHSAHTTSPSLCSIYDDVWKS
jgi:hypothetical protein